MELRANEEIRYDGKVMWFKKKLQAFEGRLVVTNQRIIFDKSKIHVGGGLLTRFVGSKVKSTRAEVLLDEDISKLRFSKGRTIRKQNYLLEVKNGEEQFDFQIDDEILNKMGISLSQVPS